MKENGEFEGNRIAINPLANVQNILLIRDGGTIWCSVSMFVSCLAIPINRIESVSAVSYDSCATEPK
jgi:hypothetical protein